MSSPIYGQRMKSARRRMSSARASPFRRDPPGTMGAAPKKFSQGYIEHRTGLLRFYISRAENNHTVPSLVTLEKWAKAVYGNSW